MWWCLWWWCLCGGGGGVFKHVRVVRATRSSSVLLKGSTQSSAFAGFFSFQCKSYEISMRTLSFSACSEALVIWKLFVRRKSKGRGEFITGQSKEEAVFRQLFFFVPVYLTSIGGILEKNEEILNAPILSAKGKSQPGPVLRSLPRCPAKPGLVRCPSGVDHPSFLWLSRGLLAFGAQNQPSKCWNTERFLHLPPILWFYFCCLCCCCWGFLGLL